MTDQVGDLIIVDGMKKQMPYEPDLPMPDPRIIDLDTPFLSTDCWRGYVATWEIMNGFLYLKSIEGKYALRDNKSIFADWVSMQFDICFGEILRRGFDLSSTIFEHHTNFKIENGCVVGIEQIDNRPRYSVYKDIEYPDHIPLDISLEEYDARLDQCISNATEKIVKHRGITSVFHFTKAGNIPSILEHGLHGREKLFSKGIAFELNDEYRNDGFPDAICASLSFPNYKMLYFLRNKYPGDDWAILRLDVRLLWELPCIFCASNAASAEVKKYPLVEKRGFLAINCLFGDVFRGIQRKDLNIPESYPTDPQAEVLILESLSPDYILNINFDSAQKIKSFPKIKNEVKQYRERFRFFHNPNLFSSRSDYKFWQNTEFDSGYKDFFMPDF